MTEANSFSDEYLTSLKEAIESYDSGIQLNILRIITEYPECIVNENQSGIYMNLRYFSEPAIKAIAAHVQYLASQEEILNRSDELQQQYSNMLKPDDHAE